MRLQQIAAGARALFPSSILEKALPCLSSLSHAACIGLSNKKSLMYFYRFLTQTPGVVVIQQGQPPMHAQTTTVQTFHQAPPPPNQQAYPNQQPYPNQQTYPGDPEMGVNNAAY